jgi:Flp pilus assembly protein TadD
MADSLLSSEEYDERAHRLYDDGQYDNALTLLKDGLRLYPHSVDLYVGLGYTHLAREDYIWAKQAFERGLVLDPNHEDALVGLGEALLRFGRRDEALQAFGRARDLGGDDLELLLSMGRALYREKMFEEAHRVFDEAATVHGDSSEAAAALGYALHRLGDDAGAARQLRRSLLLDAQHHEARVFLGHLLYDRGDWAGALREFERIEPADHWDALALSRTVELMRALRGLATGDTSLAPWEERLEEVEAGSDSIDALLAEIEDTAVQPESASRSSVEETAGHRVVLPGGQVVYGTWDQIVLQIRDLTGAPNESVAEYMRRRAEEERMRGGPDLVAFDAAEFLRAGDRAGLWRIED